MDIFPFAGNRVSYIIYDFFDGCNLSINNFKKDKQSTYLNQFETICALTMFKELVQTVDELHQKSVFHLDIKPENILCNNDTF
jgi:serine/threonine protein kinase